MSTQNFQRGENGVGLALPLSHTSMTRRTSRSQKQCRRSQGVIGARKPEIEGQPKFRRMSDLRLIELMNKRDRQARAVSAKPAEKKTKKTSGREHFFHEFFQFFQEENRKQLQRPQKLTRLTEMCQSNDENANPIKLPAFKPYRELETMYSCQVNKKPPQRAGFKPYRETETYHSRQVSREQPFREKSRTAHVPVKTKTPFKEVPLNAMEGWQTKEKGASGFEWLEDESGWQ